MAPKFVVILCYWGGKICDGPQGIAYDKSPGKAIKVQNGIHFGELINQIHLATSIDRHNHHIKIICRYPLGVGNKMKYISLPITDDNDIEVMFHVLSVHQDLSNIELYLELEVNETQQQKRMKTGTQESTLIENEISMPREIAFERNSDPLPTMRHINVMSDIIQNMIVFYRYCLRHFISNFHDRFHNSQLKALAYRAGSQNQVRKFNSSMEEIDKLNPPARQWLERHPLARWTLSHDGGKRYGMLTTNMSGNFNSVLKGARFLPITTCVQLTFYRVVHYFDVKRSLGFAAQANRDVFTPHAVAKLAASTSKASAHVLKSFNRGRGICEVTTQRGKNVRVDNLEEKTCTCGKWEINKYPCSHVCTSLSLNIWQYVQRYYSIVEYCATWASEFFSLPHEAYWPQSSITLLPNSDLKRKEKGRPRSTRLRNGMDIKERKEANHCGICRKSGHNQKTCPSRPRRMPADL